MGEEVAVGKDQTMSAREALSRASKAYGAQDYAEAAKWYRLAADQGYTLAQFTLGRMYAFGVGVPQDYGEAAKWYRRIATTSYLKHADAQYLLGLMYDIGQGVPQDYGEAYFWLNLAAADEDQQRAGNIRDRIAKLMTPADVSKFQRLSRDWFEAHKKK